MENLARPEAAQQSTIGAFCRSEVPPDEGTVPGCAAHSCVFVSGAPDLARHATEAQQPLLSAATLGAVLVPAATVLCARLTNKTWP